MAYDLYGNYYARERDAIAAETAQMAEIDAARAERKADEAIQRLHDMQYQGHYSLKTTKTKEMNTRRWMAHFSVAACFLLLLVGVIVTIIGCYHKLESNEVGIIALIGLIAGAISFAHFKKLI